MTVLELDACSVRSFGDEAHLDLTGAFRIGLELPLQVDVPADDEPGGRLEGEDAGPAAVAAVDAAVVDVAALAWLEDHLGELGLQDVVLGRPPRGDAVGEALATA